VAYFDQLRAKLALDRTVIDNIADGSEYTEINGQRRHVLGYLQDFLFSPERARTPLRALSGGERNRVLLARLFAQPANLLVMDEPTNDLDLETLELLEELLIEYPGTLLVASHDRAFLDNVVTSTLVFEGAGRVQEYVGGYSDWVRYTQRLASAKATESAKRAPSQPSPAVERAAKPRRHKLSFREARELADTPGRIEALEREQAELGRRVSEPAFYKSDVAEQAHVHARLAALPAELAAAYGRWEALEALRGEP
jgi:ATP-binding cassette subfamily F protein uup